MTGSATTYRHIGGSDTRPAPWPEGAAMVWQVDVSELPLIVANPNMAVTFRKRGRACSWTAVRPPRTIVPGPTMAAGGDLPHDLYTFVIESALGLEFGFWGCVAAGATFKTLGRKPTPQGRAVIARHIDDLNAAEARVNEIYFGWRSGTATPFDDELNTMLARWQALLDDEAITLEWAPQVSR